MKTDIKTIARQARRRRIRSRIVGTANRPRIAVYRSNTTLSAQVIDDADGKTLASVSTAKMKGKTFSDKVEEAGKGLAILIKNAGIQEVVFDRGGYAYTGNIMKFADVIRGGGIKF
jgi:large subunit ribosomal protein L18